MRNLSFNDGKESFTINGDTSRVIRFNPADPEIINRILKVQKDFSNYEVPEDIELNPDGSPKKDAEKNGAYVAEVTKAMRTAFNDIFNEDVYDTIFAGQSPLCITGEQYLYEGVLDGLLDIMKPAVEAYNQENQKRMSKYLGTIK